MHVVVSGSMDVWVGYCCGAWYKRLACLMRTFSISFPKGLFSGPLSLQRLLTGQSLS